jgi:hypothetical protein
VIDQNAFTDGNHSFAKWIVVVARAIERAPVLVADI